jgi:hypothetical protein
MKCCSRVILLVFGMSMDRIWRRFFGIAAIRDHLLPRWNALPIVAGSWVVILWLLSFVFFR